jgi:outer membrane protein OmpA-like peptidoglycan-associated protein
VSITAKDASGREVSVLTTGADGKYLVETMQGTHLQITAGRDKYQAGTLAITAGSKDTVYNQELCLVPVPKPDLFAGKKILVTHNINFGFRKKDLTPESYPYLDEVVAYLKENETVKLEIDAHTDGIGTTAFNLRLSQQRAEACVDYLVKAGITRERLIAKGYGESAPLEKEFTLSGKDSPAAREKNRRVEMKLLNQ